MWPFKKKLTKPETTAEFINRTHTLPCCGSAEFYEGPRGGLNTNIRCANNECGQNWNLAQFNGTVIYAEKI